MGIPDGFTCPVAVVMVKAAHIENTSACKCRTRALGLDIQLDLRPRQASTYKCLTGTFLRLYTLIVVHLHHGRRDSRD